MTSPSLLSALLALQPLERMPRTGWIQAGMPWIETVAAHSHSTALLVLALGARVEPALDVDHACRLAVLHDVPEALLGDIPRSASELLPSGAKREAERRAAELLLAPFGAGLERACGELAEQRTREARFTRACDRLQLGLRLLGYLRGGARVDRQFRDWIAAQELTEFAPCVELQRELVSAIDRIGEAS
ncbi:MAG: HD domain-containing protein [Planctomycetota bacterium]|nr:MAG: HD domain-containing protein [Planctomycetota bacterium]